MLFFASLISTFPLPMLQFYSKSRIIPIAMRDRTPLKQKHSTFPQIARTLNMSTHSHTPIGSYIEKSSEKKQPKLFLIDKSFKRFPFMHYPNYIQVKLLYFAMLFHFIPWSGCMVIRLYVALVLSICTHFFR